MKRYLCFDVGGTTIKYKVLNEEGEASSSTQELPTVNGDNIVKVIMKITKCYHDEASLTGVAISSAGVVDPIEGTIVYAGYTIPNYIGVNLKKIIENEFKIPCAVENDVNAAALGEFWKGSSKGSKSTFCMTVGTGIGGSIMFGDKVWHGANLTAGEIGYLNINGDYFQEIASTRILVEKVNASNEFDHILDGKDIFDYARSGNKTCKNAIIKFIDVLALGLSDIMYLLSPETIVLGGGIMAQEDYLKPLLLESLNKSIIDQRFMCKKIVFAHNGNDAGMLGALYNLLNQ